MDLTALLQPFNGILLIYWAYLVVALIWGIWDLVDSKEYRLAKYLGVKYRIGIGFAYHGIWIIPLILTYRIGGV